MAPPNNSEADVRRRPQVGEIPPLASYSPKGNETATAKKIVPSAPFAAVWEKPTFTLKDVRDAIPAHCFKRDNLTSFSYVFKDLAMVLALWYAATWISSLPTAAQYIAWPAYWWAQGAVATGVWVIAHGAYQNKGPECGNTESLTSLFGVRRVRSPGLFRVRYHQQRNGLYIALPPPGSIFFMENYPLCKRLHFLVVQETFVLISRLNRNTIKQTHT